MPPPKTSGTVQRSSGGLSSGQAMALPLQARPPAGATRLASGALKLPGQGKFVSIYNDQVGGQIVAAVRSGLPYTFACHKHGVKQSTGAMWLKRGEEEDGSSFEDFAMAVRQAQAEFVEEAIQGIKDAGLSDAKQWTALMTLLERIYPEYFRRPSDGASTTINVAVGLVEKKLHELHAAGEIVYTGA